MFVLGATASCASYSSQLCVELGKKRSVEANSTDCTSSATDLFVGSAGSWHLLNVVSAKISFRVGLHHLSICDEDTDCVHSLDMKLMQLGQAEDNNMLLLNFSCWSAALRGLFFLNSMLVVLRETIGGMGSSLPT